MARESSLNSHAISFSRSEERAMLIVTCSAAFLFFNSFGSIGVALPVIQKQFGNTLSEIQWVSLMGVVTISSLSFCFGRAGEILGERRLYKIGVALYASGAGLGALANSFSQLLSARAVMAVGLAMALPMSTAILAASFGAERRGRVLGLFASAIAVGRMTGPTAGGLLLEVGGWPSIFWMNFLIGFGVVAAVMKIFRGPGGRRAESFDFAGALALLVGYPALLLGLTFAADQGWGSPLVVLSFAMTACALPGFFWIEKRAHRPLIDVAIFRRRKLSASLLSVALSNMIHYPIALCAPLFLQNALGAPATAAGLMLAILPFSTALTSPISGRLADRFNATTVAASGLVIIMIGIIGYSRLQADAAYPLVLAALACVGVGIGIFTPANQTAAFSSVKQEDYGVLAAMLSSFGTAAGTIGTAMATALMESAEGPRLWTDPRAFADAQQFAFAWIAPIGVLALIATLRSRRERNALEIIS